MVLSSQTIDFLQFIMVGILLAIVFDIFRAYRKYKKVNRNFVMVQDIIYFFIALCILISSIILFLDNSLRFYLFIGMFLGISIYLSIFSKYVMKLYINTFRLYNKILAFFVLPLKLVSGFTRKIYNIFKKIVKKACKMIKNVIIYMYNKIKCVKVKFLKFNIQKRVKNGKFKKEKRREKKKN